MLRVLRVRKAIILFQNTQSNSVTVYCFGLAHGFTCVTRFSLDIFSFYSLFSESIDRYCQKKVSRPPKFCIEGIHEDKKPNIIYQDLKDLKVHRINHKYKPI